MDNDVRVKSKVGVVFQIAQQYLLGQIPLDEAKEHLSYEMTNIRPIEFEAVKIELGNRLKEAGRQVQSEKLIELFYKYLPLPYNKLEKGHPFRNYYEENSRARSYLVRIDEMEGEEATLDSWRNIYELVSKFQVHIIRQRKNFYPLMLSMGMHSQVEKAKELGDIIINQMNKNQEMLENGDTFNFFFNQRSVTQNLMNYIDLEERVLFPKALMSLNKQNFLELKRLDDIEGYVYIDQIEDFIPKENENNFASKEGTALKLEIEKKEVSKVNKSLGLILPALLASKEMGMIYYTLSGEVLYTMGHHIEEDDLKIADETRQSLLTGNEKQIKYWYKQEEETVLISYSLVLDSQGKAQGILKTKENPHYGNMLPGC